MPDIQTVSTLQVIIFSIIATLFAIPTAMVLKRTGHSPALALLCYVPVLALIGLWVLAFAKWPSDGAQS